MAWASKSHPIRLGGQSELRRRNERTAIDRQSAPGGPSLSSEVQQFLVPKPAHREVSIALHNLRGLAIALLLMLHSSLAYLGSVQASSYPFDRPPYGWLAFPVLDHERWFGFDLFGAWQDVYLMALMFFLSGIFTWPSLARDGAGKFFARRLLRLGAPFVLGVTIVMPVALYPVYRITNASPTLSGYIDEYLGLPFVPNGPMWFLWLLLAFNALTAGVHRFWPLNASTFETLWDTVARRPTGVFAAWLLIAAAAYVPLALAFTPWTWVTYGPLGVQFSRPLLYLVFFCSGLVVGAHGLGQGLLNETGIAARNLKTLLAAAGGSLLLWMGLTGLGLHLGDAAPLVLTVAADASYPLAGGCSLLFLLAVCLRFGTAGHWPLLVLLSDSALGVYFLHYAPVVWLQYALLGIPWPAPMKGVAVFFGAVAMCLGTVVAGRSLAVSARVRATRRRSTSEVGGIGFGPHH